MADPFTWVSIASTVGGTILQASGQRRAAKSQEQAALVTAQRRKQASDFEAAQLAQQANRDQAIAQRSAMDETRRAKLIASRALAVAGASGAGASDPSVANLLADLEGEGAYRSRVALYEGEERGRQLRMGAAARDFEGDLALEGGRMGADAARRKGSAAMTSTILSGASSLYTKYGMGGPKADTGYGLSDDDWGF